MNSKMNDLLRLVAAISLVLAIVACENRDTLDLRQKFAELEGKVSALQRHLAAAKASENGLHRRTLSMEQRMAALVIEFSSLEISAKSGIEGNESRLKRLEETIDQIRLLAQIERERYYNTIADVRRQARLLKNTSTRAQNALRSIRALSTSVAKSTQRIQDALKQHRSSISQTTNRSQKIKADIGALAARLKSVETALSAISTRFHGLHQLVQSQAKTMRALKDRQTSLASSFETSAAVSDAKIRILFGELRNLRRRLSRAPTPQR